MNDILEGDLSQYKLAYRDWLVDKISSGFEEYVDNHLGLIDELFEFNFYTIIPMDKNRANGGITYRESFAYDYGIDPSQFISAMGTSAKVLEVLVDISYLCGEEIGGGYKGDRTADWFWRLIKNLGLDWVVGDELELETKMAVIMVLSRWLGRNFEPDGSGGLFPLKNPPGDERNVEILYQMRAYINENFPVL